MGALVTKALRPIKSFNIENRAHRIISKEKPVPAPRYPTNIEDLKRTLESDPDIDKKLDRKDDQLDDRLKEVYVTAHGIPEDDLTREKRIKQSKDRPLPQDRKMPEDYDFGFREPDRVAYGHATLRQVLEFLSAHQASPEDVTAPKIALEYKLREEDVHSILKYFKAFEIYIPETTTSPATFAGPTTSRKQLQILHTREIEAKKDSRVPESSSKQDSETKHVT